MNVQVRSVVVYCALDIIPFKKPCDHEGDTSRFIIVCVVIRAKTYDDMPELLFLRSMPEPTIPLGAILDGWLMYLSALSRLSSDLSVLLINIHTAISRYRLPECRRH